MANSAYARLTIAGPDLSKTVDVSFGTITLGRQGSNEVPLPSSLVSRRHAQIHCDEEGCQIEDLGSSNGTVVNGELLDPQVRLLLKDGDSIEVGPFQIEFHLVGVGGDESAEAPEPDEMPEPPPPEEPAEKHESPVEKSQAEESAAPPPAPPAITTNGYGDPDELPPIPPGLDRFSRHYLDFLPPIYHSDFMSRFLALFEAILMPVEWTIDGFDMFLDPNTAPSGFLPWLQNWFLIVYDDTWNDEKRRAFLQEAHRIYARRGTRWALERTLEIYLGQKPEIDDDAAQLEPLTFTVRIPVPEASLDRELIENLIDLNKPSHTTYQLSFAR